MKRYNLSSIMKAAWRLYRKGIASFAVALRMAWANAKTHATAKESVGVTEEAHTWYGWKELGYEVRHGSKAMYQATVTDPATKNGTRKTNKQINSGGMLIIASAPYKIKEEFT